MAQQQVNNIYVKPIVYGNVSFWLGKKATDEITHKWCVYVRGNNNEDISSVVKEVSFTLHASFHNHVRMVTKPPFELYESGWGEFDIKIHIYLHDTTLKPLEILHGLKLHPFLNHHVQTTKRPVISEFYDEIIIVNPKPSFLQRIEQVKVGEDADIKNQNVIKAQLPTGNNQSKDMDVDSESVVSDPAKSDAIIKSSLMNEFRNNPSYFENVESHFAPLSDEANLKQIQEINAFVSKEINKLKSTLEENENQINSLKKNIKEISSKCK